jgi:tetratricopeptide (TPR) repeat protein
MATKHKSSKAKAPQKAKAKPVKKSASHSVKPSKQKIKSAAKSSAKLTRPAPAKAKTVTKAKGKKPAALSKSGARVGARSTNVRVPSQQFAGAVTALEAGIKLMYAEDYGKAVKAFNKVIADYPEEPEIQASAKARIQACEKKIQDRTRTVLRSADDHYNVAVAFLNGGQLDSAVTHLQSALKLAPKADHILYAIAAANALKGNKDQALVYLKQSIDHRAENRFQAAVDPDFAALSEEQSFKDLVASPVK